MIQMLLARPGAVAVLLVVWMGVGCVEPHCPKGYDERGDTCYRRRDAGPDAEAVEAGDDDAGEEAADAAAAPNDDGVDSGERTTSEFDASRPDASGAPPPDASGSPGDASSDAGVASDAAPDTSVRAEPCQPNPCLHGGTCTPNGDKYTCKCSALYTGGDCELQICESVSIKSRLEVGLNASCGEIRGDLSIPSIGLSEILAEDFASLERITGSLVVSSNRSDSGKQLQRVTLSRLESVGGMIDVRGDPVGLVGPLVELHLPALVSIGSKVTTGGSTEPLSIQIAFTDLKVLDLPVVSSIGGNVRIGALQMCTANLPNIGNLSGEVSVTAPKVSARAFDALSRNATGGVQILAGCCLDSASDKSQCAGFTPAEFERYCTGC